MGEPGFWDDPDTAARTNAEYARANRRLTTFESLERDAEDLGGLVELAEEDPDLASEVEDALRSVESRLEELDESEETHVGHFPGSAKCFPYGVVRESSAKPIESRKFSRCRYA